MGSSKFIGNLLFGSNDLGRAEKDSSLEFVLVNPEIYFQSIVASAHSVILAGGTMQPFDHLTQQLFHGPLPSRLEFFSCGHVIPPENLQTVIFGSGPTGKTFKFDYENRANTNMIVELGNLIINSCTLVPDGVVLFFASYSYEEEVHQTWLKHGVTERLEKKKSCFVNPRMAQSMFFSLITALGYWKDVEEPF